MPIASPRKSKIGTHSSSVVRDSRLNSGEHTSNTRIAAALTEDSADFCHGSLKSLNSEAERFVPGLNSNMEQSLASSDAE